jgi:hypothetical protein
MVEFATTNCQSIMKGWTASDNTLALITGHTDAIKTPSGSANNDPAYGYETCNIDGRHACKYRGIENLWGNIWKWCDGISFSKEKVFICTDPTAYRSAKVDAPYFYMGDRCTSTGYASVITPFEKMPLLGCTTAADGSPTTYYSNRYNISLAGTVLVVSGGWNNGADAGLWYRGDSTASYANVARGGRLCYKPIQNS